MRALAVRHRHDCGLALAVRDRRDSGLRRLLGPLDELLGPLDVVIERASGWRILRLEADCARDVGNRIQLRQGVLRARIDDGVRLDFIGTREGLTPRL